MQPLVSILIPAFNSQALIAETLESALAQTWPYKEIIVVDDGSTDETAAIARGFSERGVRVVTQKNQGAAAARNRAFSLCRGDYVQWLDADDLLAPDKIAQQVDALVASGRTLLSSSWGHFIYRSSKARFVPTALWCDLSPQEWLLRKLEHGAFMQTSVWLVSRELTEVAGPWNTNLAVDDDGEYFCRVILASDGIKFVPGAKVFYRRSGIASLSHIGRSQKKLESQFDSLCFHIKYLRSVDDSVRSRSACLAYLQAYLPYFYPERLDLVGKLRELAEELGGKLERPNLSWKYAWIQKCFGWASARRLQIVFPQCKWGLIHLWDRTLFHLETRQRLRDC